MDQEIRERAVVRSDRNLSTRMVQHNLHSFKLACLLKRMRDAINCAEDACQRQNFGEELAGAEDHINQCSATPASNEQCENCIMIREITKAHDEMHNSERRPHTGFLIPQDRDKYSCGAIVCYIILSLILYIWGAITYVNGGSTTAPICSAILVSAVFIYNQRENGFDQNYTFGVVVTTSVLGTAFVYLGLKSDKSINV